MTNDVAPSKDIIPTPVLTLTIEEPEPRAFIEIDGKRYELAEPDDYSVIELRDMGIMWKFLGDLDSRQGKISQSESERYDDYLNKLVRKSAPSIPPEIIDHPNFGRTDKVGIIYYFFVEGAKRNPLLRRMNLSSLLPLPDSNDSMEATRPTG